MDTDTETVVYEPPQLEELGGVVDLMLGNGEHDTADKGQYYW
ncbi:lasso RiPP family leader peptide-containing protein [Saccharopolyspora phatthalungensis]|uniref:Lasso RiPP family leader peptide-containing protein n=1 Tax=Saccharopolyspora phatthalungensis TaxID=664693 RepID=A0A840Q1D6_9PSEU|nr:lasso RiPP family leader peptide-containing protein [Saccharopolyspora phatthalungensis]MBB5152559.1 hypothetical protein [Saccharopolyspora phatthalungensis]